MTLDRTIRSNRLSNSLATNPSKNVAMRLRTLISRSAMFLGISGTVFGLGKVHAAYIGHYDLTGSSRFGWIIVFSSLCWAIAYSFGLPEVKSLATRWKSSLAASFVSCALFIGVQAAIAETVLPRFLLALSVPGVFVSLVLVSTASSMANQQAASRERVLLISSPADRATVQADIDFHVEVPCILVDFFDDASNLNHDDILDCVARQSISLIVLSEAAHHNPTVLSAVSHAHSCGTRVRSILAFYNDWIGKIPVRELQATALLFDVREIHHVGYARVSRLIDIVIALLGSVALIPIIPIVIMGNQIANRGPLLYGQERIGRGQKNFKIFKFRTMRPNSSDGEWTQKHDPRVTAFGQFLRRSHLDELPQVLNILRGDLSIVGPRPEQLQYVDKLAESIPYYNARHLVRPGLTGWAQVNYPYGADEIDAFEKLQYEFWYLQHQSLSVDLRIIARTFRHVLGFKGQ